LSSFSDRLESLYFVHFHFPFQAVFFGNGAAALALQPGLAGNDVPAIQGRIRPPRALGWRKNSSSASFL
jgi:hypothetical protein